MIQAVQFLITHLSDGISVVILNIYLTCYKMSLQNGRQYFDVSCVPSNFFTGPDIDEFIASLPAMIDILSTDNIYTKCIVSLEDEMKTKLPHSYRSYGGSQYVKRIGSKNSELPREVRLTDGSISSEPQKVLDRWAVQNTLQCVEP